MRVASNGSQTRRAAAAFFLLLQSVAVADERIADIRQGTNLTVTLAPNGSTLVVDLLGQLWSLPLTGGGAVPLTMPGIEARNPRFSPDGSQVVYQSFRDGQWDLWVLDVTTKTTRPVAISGANEREPDFTPDGRSVIFTSDRTGHACLWSVALDSGVETQLTEEAGEASYPVASVQGSIAYAHERDGGWSIRVLGRDGVSSVVHDSVHPLAAPSWRPGGGVLVFAEQESRAAGRLWMLILGEPQVLKPASGLEDIFVSRPAWVSGAEFVYAADGALWRRGLASPTRQLIHLFAASATPVVAAPTTARAPSAPGTRSAVGINGVEQSPDGRRTVFTALGDVWLAEHGRLERLTEDTSVERDPTFWPDGKSLVVASDRGGQFELWHLSLAERKFSQITFGAVNPRRPAVRPEGHQIAYLEAESYEPWATTRLKVRDWPSGSERTLARELEGAIRASWSTEPPGLSVEANAGRAAEDARHDLRVTLVQPLTARAAPSLPAITAGLPAVQWSPSPAPSDYVVEVGRLFDGTNGAYRRHVDVHVRAGRIAAVTARGLLTAQGRIIDARDHTMIPGFIDVHVHQTPLAGERFGRAWLAYGVTTVRELATDPLESIERAETWASGSIPGPRLLTSSISPDGSPRQDSPDALPGVTAGFAHSLPQQIAALGTPRSLAPSFRGAAQTLPPLARTGLDLELSPALVVYQDRISRFVASEAVLASGLAALGQSRADARDPAYRSLFNPVERSLWERPGPPLDVQSDLGSAVARLARSGGRVAVGSEAPAVPVGQGFHRELIALANTGLTPEEILRMATMGGALALGLERDIGSIEEGKLADFVVLDGDPLTDVRQSAAIVAVVKDGHWYDRPALLGPR